MTDVKKIADELNFKISDSNTFDENSEIIVAALQVYGKQEYARAIEDAAKLVQSHGRYTLSGFIVSGTDLPKEIRALKDVKR